MHRNKKSNSKLQLAPKMQQEDKKKCISPSIDGYTIKMKKITLSSQLEINNRVQQQEIQKISLVHKNITLLDRIFIAPIHQFKSEKIKYLYLSNNFISDIEHIQQFSNLQTLSLSYNQIMKLTNIRYLSPLSKLSYLALEGNPISKSPFYLPYIVGVTSIHSNGHVLKKVDKINAEHEWRRENIKNWDVYEQSMGEMIRNYMRLIYMMQLWKKMSFHRVITIAFAQISRKQIVTQNGRRLEHKIDLYLDQAEKDIKELPTKYIMNIQSTIYEDINRISARRLQSYILHENQNQEFNSEQQTLRSQKMPMIQIYVASMYELLQRQKQKITEIKQKILAKYACSPDAQHISFQSQFSSSSEPLQRQSYNQFLNSFYTKAQEEKQLDLSEGQRHDIQRVQQLLEYSLHRCQKSKQSMYYEWKLIAKIFNRFKLYSQKINKMKYSALTLARILSNKASEKFRMGFCKIKQMRKVKMMEAFVETLWRKMKSVRQTCFWVILEDWKMKGQQLEQYGIQDNYRQRLEDKMKTRKIWKAWKTLAYNENILKQNKQLKEQIGNYQKREQKLTNKLHLLEKLLEVTEKKLSQKQVKQNDPKWLLNEIEKNCLNLRSRSPSPKSLIRKNKCFKNQNDDDGQFSMDKENSQLRNNLIIQRKFNSSKKCLTIDKYNS